MSLPVVDLGISYESERDKIEDFLSRFKGEKNVTTSFANLNLHLSDEDTMPEGIAGLKYMSQLQIIANREQDALVIDLEDIYEHEKTLGELVSRIIGNTRRYVNLFSEAVDKIMPQPTKDISDKDEVIDVIIHQRRERNAQMDGSEMPFPEHLLRRYNLYFRPLKSDVVMAVREVRGAHLGRLITVRGIVTRVSEVKPLLLVNAYTCDSCGCETFEEVSNKTFMPLSDCPNEMQCKRDGVRGTLHMQTRACRFSPFQEVKVQEMADQVPVGHIPRSMSIHVNGSLTRQLSPGDVVHLGGIFLPVPYTGFQAIRAGLLTDTYLEVQHIHQLRKQYSDMEMTPQLAADLEKLNGDEQLYNKLARSIAPEIFGHDDVKKALLLLLVGGVTKQTDDGMKIRGDINICLMGDPGVAKSQLLKYISKIAPRGVYTTGKGSSGVGLTAAVMRDPVTDEMVLEGGALVLADNGICCIDEFDKMEESDRTAIHEVMEQQTISISKAGISTTLNARTSILAAANPLFGRYNVNASPVENINLPAALLSRFDLMFLILDKPSRDADEQLAHHVTHVHMFSRHPDLGFEVIEPVLFKHYIAKARQIRPTVPAHVSNYIVESYVSLRKASKDEVERDKSNTYTSARTLLAILRLAQGLARLRWNTEVTEEDVNEALRLMKKSKESVLLNEEEDEFEPDQSAQSKIYRLIKAMARTDAGPRVRRMGRGPNRERDMDVDEEDDDGSQLLMTSIRQRVLAQGYTETQLMDTIRSYENLDVWQRSANNQKLIFIDAGERYA